LANRLARFDAMSVLVVDDNQATLDLLTAVLTGEGFPRVITERDPTRVVDLLPFVNPDLVLLDLHMPHVDGYAVLQSIAVFAAGSYLPVLVLTADATTSARDRALEHGARDFLTKPLDITEVVLRIANLLETRQLYAATRDKTAAPETVDGRDLSSIRRKVQTVLRDNGVIPHFQPVVDLTNAATVGYEALARFTPPDTRGPAGWFRDAFEVGLGVELEWLAAKNALSAFESVAPGAFLALNLSPASVLQLREEALCPPADCPQIVIELTEHVPVEDYAAIHDSLRELRRNGARLAADDIGAGYAGLRHLLALEPDIIKLDISLVSGIDSRPGARALVKALVAFADDIGADIIAEGVEEGGEAEELRSIGVHWAQGNFLGRPQLAPGQGHCRG
jgi:EAL domain-containing protein (putative c-di-GMP-specific phosphodiesterase class I)/CheY-like chemotaxis protein